MCFFKRDIVHWILLKQQQAKKRMTIRTNPGGFTALFGRIVSINNAVRYGNNINKEWVYFNLELYFNGIWVCPRRAGRCCRRRWSLSSKTA